MPLYEFKCKSCGEEFDRVLSVRELEAGGMKCPSCDDENVVQLLSGGLIRIGLGGYAGKVR